MRENYDILFAAFELSDGGVTRKVNELNTEKVRISQRDRERVISCLLDGRGFGHGRKAFSGAVWGKAYRKSFIEVNQLLFDPELRRAQDIEFNIRAVSLAGSIVNCQIPVNHYELREGSLSHQRNQLLLGQYESYLKKVQKDLEEYQSEELRNDYYWMALSLTLDLWKRGGVKIKATLENELFQEAVQHFSWSPARGLKKAIKWVLFKLKAYTLLEKIAEKKI